MSEVLEEQTPKLSIKEAGVLSLPNKPLQWITEYCDLSIVFNLRLVCKRFETIVRDGKRLTTSIRVISAGFFTQVVFRIEHCHSKKIEDIRGWLQGENSKRDFWISRLTRVYLCGLDFGLTIAVSP